MPFILNCLAALLVLSANASVAADAVAIGGAVERFLAERMTALPGEGSFSVGRFNADRLAGDCEGYEVSMDPGARLWGRTQVAVRCRGAGWRIWVPVQIRVVGDYLVAAQPIAAGRTLGEADLGKQRGDLAELPAGVLLDPSHAVGRAAIGAIPAGRPLRGEMLRQPTVIHQGQTVRIIGTGPGFQVSNEGRALASAAVGQVAQVRLNSGQTVSGIVRRDGAVEVRF